MCMKVFHWRLVLFCSLSSEHLKLFKKQFSMKETPFSWKQYHYAFFPKDSIFYVYENTFADLYSMKDTFLLVWHK